MKPEPILASPCIDGEVSTDEMTFSAKDFQVSTSIVRVSVDYMALIKVVVSDITSTSNF